MTQTPTPMNQEFTAINRRALAQAIKAALLYRMKDLTAKIEQGDFETGFYGAITDPIPAQLKLFKDFYDGVVIFGWDFMRNQADTPAEIEQAFKFLNEKGVNVLPPSSQ